MPSTNYSVETFKTVILMFLSVVIFVCFVIQELLNVAKAPFGDLNVAKINNDILIIELLVLIVTTIEVLSFFLLGVVLISKVTKWIFGSTE